MPAKSEAQRKLFAIAQSMQQGRTKKSYSPAAARIASTVKPSSVKDFTHLAPKKKKKFGLKKAEEKFEKEG